MNDVTQRHTGNEHPNCCTLSPDPLLSLHLWMWESQFTGAQSGPSPARYDSEVSKQVAGFVLVTVMMRVYVTIFSWYTGCSAEISWMGQHVTTKHHAHTLFKNYGRFSVYSLLTGMFLGGRKTMANLFLHRTRAGEHFKFYTDSNLINPAGDRGTLKQ